MTNWDGSTAVPTFTVERARASKLANISTLLTALTDEWTDYSSTFAISAVTTPPTKGASVYVARYKRIGKWVDYMFSVTIGAGWASGSGAYIFPLPVAARAVQQQVGPARVFDTGTAYRYGFLEANTSTSQSRIILDSGTDFLGSAGPGTAWATGDIIVANIRYEAA